MTTTEVFDLEALQSWLGDALGAPLVHLDVELLPQGHANGAWRVVADTAAPASPEASRSHAPPVA